MNKVIAIQNMYDQSSEVLEQQFNLIMENFNFLKDIIFPGETVLIKPNFVAPSEKATTNIVLLKCMIKLLQSLKAIPVVAESSGFEFSTEYTFQILELEKISHDMGVKIINLDNEKYMLIDSGNSKVPQYLLPELINKVDKIINMPCLKGHSLTKVTFGIKNLFGLLHRETRRKIHATDLELGIAKLSKLIKVDFTLVSGIWNLKNAVYSNSSYQGLIIAGNDVYNTDQICCKIMGIDYRTIPHIYMEMPNNPFEYQQLSAVRTTPLNLDKRPAHFIIHNIQYKLIYMADLLFSKITNFSLIPYFHYYLGIRPVINRKKCTNCKRCEEICPGKAIIKNRIIGKKCMQIRCFKCFDACDFNAIEKKGLHK